MKYDAYIAILTVPFLCRPSPLWVSPRLVGRTLVRPAAAVKVAALRPLVAGSSVSFPNSLFLDLFRFQSMKNHSNIPSCGTGGSDAKGSGKQS